MKSRVEREQEARAQVPLAMQFVSIAEWSVEILVRGVLLLCLLFAVECALMPSRPLIGFVTSGGYSLTRARGCAIGACVASRVRTDAVVLVRNPHSPQYYKAVVNVL